MAETTPKPKRVQRPRKKSCPPNRGERAKNKRPTISQRLKERWADPEWRAALLAKRQARIDERRKAGTFPTRFGVPDGMRKAEALKKRDEVEQSVKQTMAELEKAGLLDEQPAEAKEALEAALNVMRFPGDQKLKLAAARLVLDFTKAKPASKAIVAVDDAEAWLSKIAKDDEADSGETSKDA